MELVSAVDKLHNARVGLADHRVVGEAVWARFNGGKDGTLWYYRSLVVAFRRGASSAGVARVVDELERVVDELERRAAAG